MRCLVVGASKGIGESIGKRLIASGNNVVGMSRRRLDYAQWFRLDLDDFDSTITQAVNEAIGWLSGLDLLVLSAGMGAMHTPFEETSERARSLMQVNYFGPATVWRACMRELLKSHGTMIVIGSTCADRPSPGLTLYRASKAAMHAFALNQAHVYRDRIRIHVLAPGWVDTEMTANLHPALKEKIVSKIPAGRFATADEVAASFLALLDDKDADIYGSHEESSFTVARS